MLSFFLVACGDDAPKGSDSLLHDIDVTAPDTSDTADTGTADTDVDTSTTDTDIADTSEPDTDTADTTQPDTSDTADTSEPDTVKPTCVTLPVGHTRHIVVSRPYDEHGDPSTHWETYPLRTDATLGPRTASFSLGAAGRAVGGKVAFTEDGALALAAHDRGEVSVFAIDGDGGVKVIQPATDLGPYVGSIVVRGDDVFLVDSNWQNNGGGIYHSKLACDGALSTPTLLYPTKLAYGLTLLDTANGLEHLVMAREAVDTTSGYVHRVLLRGSTWTRAASVDVFGDADAITPAMAVTPDGRYVVVADHSEFSGVPNRIGIASLDPMDTRQVLTPFDDPYDLVASPHNDAVLAVLGYANRVTVLKYDADAANPFTNAGYPTFSGQVPQLPSDAVRLHGDHEDIVYVVENTALRVFRFNGDGTVTDLGRQLFGSGLTSIPGAIGAQP